MREKKSSKASRIIIERFFPLSFEAFCTFLKSSPVSLMAMVCVIVIQVYDAQKVSVNF